MSESPDNEFKFVRTANGFWADLPSCWYPDGRLEQMLAASDCWPGITLDRRAGRLTVNSGGMADHWMDSVSALFARANGLPYFPASAAQGYVQSRDPLVSCIVLLTANDLFTYRTLIPSILACSRGVPLEIIVVYNGHGCDLELFRPFRVVLSPFGWVSKGYNRGVAVARGQYIAIFHDDCLLNDVNWVPCAVERLAAEAGADAVTPEFQVLPIGLKIAKNVPLVMRRRVFERLGGYDTKYYAGLEDVDFTYGLLASGRRVETLDIDYRHFEGMSTTLMLHQQARQLKELYGLNMIPKVVVGQMKEALFRQWAPEINRVTAGNMRRFCRKHRGYLVSRGLGHVLERARALHQTAAERSWRALAWRAVGGNRRRLMSLYRSRLTW